MVEDEALKAWFHREVFVHDGALTRFLRRNWRNESDVADLRQEIYAKVYHAAREGLPLQAKAFLFAAARNHLINQVRHAKVVSIEHVGDLGALAVVTDELTPDRNVTAREELRRLQAGLNQLPPRCREIVMLRKIEGMSIGEIAAQLGLAVSTVDNQLAFGMRALVDFMMGGTGKIQRTNTSAGKRPLDLSRLDR